MGIVKSLDRVKTTIHCNGPDKVPIWRIGTPEEFNDALVPPLPPS